jgi:hypothetical protein
MMRTTLYKANKQEKINLSSVAALMRYAMQHDLLA